MKIRIEVVNDLPEDEIVIRCGRVDETIRQINQYIIEQTRSGPKITFYKGNQAFYFSLEDVLFFETEGEHIYAHTPNDAYRIKYRLYELEEILPQDFVRASKSSIVNIRRIYSITRNITASSLIQFAGSHKKVFVSRYYYSELRRRMNAGSSQARSTQ